VEIVRYRERGAGTAQVGLRSEDGVVSLGEGTTLAELWRLPLDGLRDRLAAASSASSLVLDDVELLAPVDGRTEVWACGVTYEASREARVEESEQAADVYELVYDAERPELFFKSAAWRVSGPGRPIGVRADSTLDVPEPELALVVNRLGEVVGYTICNDVSSRSIEGENPLYLPQAKVYSGACGLGPWITPAWAVPDPYQLGIRLTIDRDGAQVWDGRASTSSLHRRLEDLVGYLMRGDTHPDGAILSTGTCLVPPPPFSLTAGDLVTIAIDGIGTLTNPVVRGHVEDAA
jgi:2-dehydro-3-deoxy-D-arabinonate dehydratase